MAKKLTAAEISAQINALQAQLDELQSEDKKKAALVTIAAKVEQAQKLIEECTKLADEAGVAFSWDLAYGMGGWYESGEWQSSSSNC